MKQTAGLTSMEKEEKQESMSGDTAPSTVVVMPERESNAKVCGYTIFH